MPPLVSILIPTRNRPELVERAIRSCLAQTCADFEIIVTDNSDNFETRDLMTRIGDQRIRYFKNDTNLGLCGNLNRSASLAEGKYAKFLMDDDLLRPRCLELMVDALEKNPGAGVAMAPMDLIDIDDRRIYPHFYIFRKMTYRYRYRAGDGLIDRREMMREYLTHDYPCCVPSAIMLRTEIFKRIGMLDPEADFALDLDLCMRIAVEYDFYYIDQVLSSFRYVPIGLTAAFHQTGFKITTFYYITRKILADKRVEKFFPAEEWPKIVRDSIFFCSCRCLLNAIAGLRARNLKLIRATFKTIFEEDRYWWNQLRLPWFMFREVWVSIFPPKLPPARE